MTEKNLVYRCDGSFRAILCCIYEIYTHREFPVKILTPEDPATLYLEKWIETQDAHARRVWKSLPQKLGRRGAQMVRDGYLTCVPEKELLLCRFIARGYEYGAGIADLLADDTVNALQKALKHLYNEAHLYRGFVRFSIHDRVMTASITPKNRVLPLLEHHFCSRYPEELFLLYDKTHREALIHQPGRAEILPMEEFTPDAPNEEERAYRRMWKKFYDTVAIRERENPRCRMTHMPKRYWGDMTEFQEEAETPAPLPGKTAEKSALPAR